MKQPICTVQLNDKVYVVELNEGYETVCSKLKNDTEIGGRGLSDACESCVCFYGNKKLGHQSKSNLSFE